VSLSGCQQSQFLHCISASQQDFGAACPSNFPAVFRGATTRPSGATAQFSELQSLGWAVTSRAATTSAPSTYTSLDDFYTSW